MSSLQIFKVVAIIFAFILVTCCLFSDEVSGSPVSAGKRDLHRYPRAKYRVGYMFGKRASASLTSSVLFDIISRNMISTGELKSLAVKNRQLLDEITRILDRNGDGYISLSDFAPQEGV